MSSGLLTDADKFGYFGQYNGFRYCIPEIAEDVLIANYGSDYSYCDLEYAAKLTYMVHEVFFDPAPYEYTNIGVDISLESPMHYEKPRERLCGGGGGGINESDFFGGTPPFYFDYYFYEIYANFYPGTLYKIARPSSPQGGTAEYTNPPETGGETSKTRYIFLNDYNSGGESFSVYYDSASQIVEAGYFISMHNDGASLGSLTIDGKVFYEYIYEVQGSGTSFPRITEVTLYSFTPP